MKKLIQTVSIALLLPFISSAQQSGEIIFKESQKLDIHLPDDMPEEMKAQIPTSKDSKKVLTFTKNVSMYANLEKNANNKEIEHNGTSEDGGEMQMKLIIMEPHEFLFKDFKENRYVEQKDLMGKDFLIKNTLKNYIWKISNEEKNILNYPCTKAIAISEKDTITAWFTMKIPVSNGPSQLTKLPGMILEASINNGKKNIIATKIDLKDVDESKIVAPSKGKEITAEKFEKLAAEKRKEMEEGAGRMEIRIKN